MLSRDGQVSLAQQAAWHALPLAEAFQRQQSDAAQGLTQAEAARRLAQYGPNTLAPARRRSVLAVLLAQFRSFIVALPVVATAIAFAMGENIEAVAILIVIVLYAAIGFSTEWKAAQALSALQRKSVQATCSSLTKTNQLTKEPIVATTTISPSELAGRLKRGEAHDLIDVRSPVEYREVHVDVARNVPLDELDPAALMQARNGTANEPLYLICRSGSRGQQACEKFLKAGFTNVVNVEGGTMACVDAGLPVIRGKSTISLERQVRIAAGILVVTGSALGYFVHPAWIGLPAFIGAGLTFAGITDTCGMGMMLAKMPWNR